MKALIVLGCLVALTACLPSTFDIRYQPHIAGFSNFDASSDSVCEAYSWARQLAQILSNRVSIDMKERIKLSAQQIVECVSFENDRCKEVTPKNIADAIKLIHTQGLTEEDCYPNRIMELPGQFCGRTCSDGRPFVRTFKLTITAEKDLPKLLENVGNGHVLGFALIKLYEPMNYYSAEKPDQMKAEGQLYSYGIAEIVGWRKQGEEVNLRMGAPGWGFKGYGFVPINSPIIAQVYSVSTLGFHTQVKQ